MVKRSKRRATPRAKNRKTKEHGTLISPPDSFEAAHGESWRIGRARGIGLGGIIRSPERGTYKEDWERAAKQKRLAKTKGSGLPQAKGLPKAHGLPRAKVTKE
ncbi:hypothetical protein HYS30_00260, partial [Candidatus Peregrinibacteria bacterium]|nr:hypothetical protein [Candidatus Peregrinibacteria bacterium]